MKFTIKTEFKLEEKDITAEFDKTHRIGKHNVQDQSSVILFIHYSNIFEFSNILSYFRYSCHIDTCWVTFKVLLAIAQGGKGSISNLTLHLVIKTFTVKCITLE